MSDPFDALREPAVPIDPDPRFAARLRARLEQAVLRGTPMTVQGHITYASVWTPDVSRAADFYAEVLGWRYAPARSPQGRHVEGLGQHLGMWSDEEYTGTYLALTVTDAEATARRVRDAGGTAGDVTQEEFGRAATCTDDQGLPFSIVESPAPAESTAVPGEIVYVTIEIPDEERTKAFFATVFDWHFTPGRVDHGWGIDDIRPMSGLHGGQPRPRVVPMYQVTDIHAATQRVQTAGGTATTPEQQPYGTSSKCTDNQGTPFYLGQL